MVADAEQTRCSVPGTVVPINGLKVVSLALSLQQLMDAFEKQRTKAGKPADSKKSKKGKVFAYFALFAFFAVDRFSTVSLVEQKCHDISDNSQELGFSSMSTMPVT
jgi:hypothetical protein